MVRKVRTHLPEYRPPEGQKPKKEERVERAKTAASAAAKPKEVPKIPLNYGRMIRRAILFLAYLLACAALGLDYYLVHYHGKDEVVDNYKEFLAGLEISDAPLTWQLLRYGEKGKETKAADPVEIENVRLEVGQMVASLMERDGSISQETLRTLERPRTIWMDVSGNTHFEIFPVLDAARNPVMPVRSTFLSDDRAFGKGNGKVIPPEWLEVDWAGQYCKLFDLPCGPLPEPLQGKKFYAAFFVGYRPAKASAIFRFNQIPPFFSIIFHREGVSLPVSFFLPSDFAYHSVFNMGRNSAAYWLVKHFNEEITWASQQIAGAHPGTHAENIRLVLLFTLFGSTSTTAGEDPWQDINARNYAGCAQVGTDKLEEAFAGKPIGPVLDGKSWNLPWPAWRLASRYFKWHLDTQSFSVYSVHMRYARQAAADPKRLGRFSPHLTPEDFASDEAALCTLTEPAAPLKAVLAKAMILDYVLTLLEEGTFKDPKIRLPANYPPFIPDEKSAREFALMCSALWAVGYPETLPSASILFLTSSRGGSCYPSLYTVGEVFGTTPNFPGLIDFVARPKDGKILRIELFISD